MFMMWMSWMWNVFQSSPEICSPKCVSRHRSKSPCTRRLGDGLHFPRGKSSCMSRHHNFHIFSQISKIFPFAPQEFHRFPTLNTRQAHPGTHHFHDFPHDFSPQMFGHPNDRPPQYWSINPKTNVVVTVVGDSSKSINKLWSTGFPAATSPQESHLRWPFHCGERPWRSRHWLRAGKGTLGGCFAWVSGITYEFCHKLWGYQPTLLQPPMTGILDRALAFSFKEFWRPGKSCPGCAFVSEFWQQEKMLLEKCGKGMERIWISGNLFSDRCLGVHLKAFTSGAASCCKAATSAILYPFVPWQFRVPKENLGRRCKEYLVNSFNFESERMRCFLIDRIEQVSSVIHFHLGPFGNPYASVSSR